jgi:hypothetical protein
MLVTFGVMNVFIGMIVDRVTTNARTIEENKELMLKLKKVETVDHLRQLLFATGEKDLGPYELKKKVKEDPELIKLFEDVDLPPDYTETLLVHMLDNNGDGRVDAEELVNNFKRLVMSTNTTPSASCKPVSTR